MVNVEALAEKVFALLKGNGFQIKIFDNEGAETTDPTLGRRFFVLNPNIMVTIDEDDNNIEFSKGASVDDSIDKLQKNIRKIADEFLMNSKIKVFGRSIQPKDYAYQAKMKKGNAMMENSVNPTNHQLVGEIMKMIRYWGGKISETDLTSNLGITDLSEIRPVLNRLVKDGKLSAILDKNGCPVYSRVVEKAITNDIPFSGITESFSRMFGSLRTSQQTLENVRLLVRHKIPVDENIRGSRSRHISAIFLESNGERFRFPHIYLPGARAMAQHIAHGGVMNDKVGSYILENTSNLLKLQSFNRYVTTNKLINEDSSGIVDTVKENIERIRTELKKLTGTKTYETIKARLETFEREPLAEDDTSQLKELFTIRRFDEKFEEVLPIVKQLVQERDTFHKRIEEAAAGVVLLRRESIDAVPMFEFASEHARLGFKLNELALRIIENEELSGFVNKIGNKLCKESQINEFEKAVLSQVLENAKIEEKSCKDKKDIKEIKESFDLETYFDKFDYMFLSTKKSLNETKFKVSFELKPHGAQTYEVEAKTSAEARKIATQQYNDTSSRGYTVKKVTVKEVK